MSETPGSVLGKSNIEFVIKKSYDLSDYTLVSGFYGIGKCGFIAINHMVQRLNAELIGYIVSDFLPPFLSVKDERMVLPFEIYKYNNIIFLTAFFEPYKYEHRSFAKSVVNWVQKNNMKRIILIGGLDSRLRTDEEVLAKAVYSSTYKEMYPDGEIPIMDEGLYITGPMALVLMYAEINGFPAIGILPYAERSRPDPIGASIAVEIVNDLLGTNCGVDELVQEAESIETEIQSMEGMLQEEKDDDESRDRGMFL